MGAIAEVGLISLMGAALWKLDTCRAPRLLAGVVVLVVELALPRVSATGAWDCRVLKHW